MSGLRIIFLGTPDFAVASLRALQDAGYNVVAVVTAPDKPAGRGQQLSISAVKKYAIECGIKILQPEKLKNPDFIEALKELKADVQVVVAFRMLPEIVWNMPKYGTYNLHASLLPKYRGAAPINWAIINGERETGVTTFKLQHEIDSGSILFAKKVTIGDTMTAGELHDILMNTGSELLVKTIRAIDQHSITGEKLEFQKQEDSLVCHAPKLFRETCKIDWNKTASEIHNLVRGLSPYPTAFSELLLEDGKKLSMKIFEVSYHLQAHDEPNGKLYYENKAAMHVYCKNGVITLLNVQLEGKRRLKTEEFLKGFNTEVSARFV